MIIHVHIILVLYRNLSHPCLLKFYGGALRPSPSGAGNELVVVTEHVGGGDLRSAIQAVFPPLSWWQAVTLARDGASAIAKLHSRGLIHR